MNVDISMALFQETIAPAGCESRYVGIRGLWLKVIIRAIFDWVSYRDSSRLMQRKLAESAYKWLFESSELFNGLESVCHHLDIDSAKVRVKAKSMTREDVAKIEHLERVVHGFSSANTLQKLLKTDL